MGQINPKLSPSRLFSSCKKISQIRVFLLFLSFLSYWHDQTLIITSALYSAFGNTCFYIYSNNPWHPLYPGADPICLDRGFKFTGGGGVDLLIFKIIYQCFLIFLKSEPPEPPLNPPLIPVWFADFLTLHGRSLR